MKKIDWLLVAIGMAVAGFLTWHAYYSNSHREVPHIDEFFYIVFFPPSIGLMVTENAGKAGQAVIVFIVVAANGGLYAVVGKVIRAALRSRQEK